MSTRNSNNCITRNQPPLDDIVGSVRDLNVAKTLIKTLDKMLAGRSFKIKKLDLFR